MPVKIAIASGKGGTGKTTVSVCLFHSLSENNRKKVQLVDCDVEEPNDIIFFTGAGLRNSWDISQMVPEIDTNKCTYCRECVEYCEFNAIVVLPPIPFAEVNPSLCHSCGACSKACRFSAISERPDLIGRVQEYDVGVGDSVIEGRLKIGSAMQTMLIKELKKKVNRDADLLLFDAPPGTSCPVVETVADADYIVLVTEPTPFGLHDLKLTVELLEDIGKDFGIVVNKAGLGDNKVYDYMTEKGLDLLGEIAYDDAFASEYATGNLIRNIRPDIQESFRQIGRRLEREIIKYEGDYHSQW